MGSNDLLGKHCSLLSCSLTCRSGRSRPAETGRHLNSLWHEGGLSSYVHGLPIATTAQTRDRVIYRAALGILPWCWSASSCSRPELTPCPKPSSATRSA